MALSLYDRLSSHLHIFSMAEGSSILYVTDDC